MVTKEEKIIRRGESGTAEPGAVVKFAVHSWILNNNGKDHWLVLRKCVFKVGDDNYLHELDGSKIEFRKYAIKVSKKSYDDYVKYYNKK